MTGIAWLGSLLVPKVEYLYDERRVYKDVYFISMFLIRDISRPRKLSARMLLMALGIINILLFISMWLKYEIDLPTVTIIRLVSTNIIGNLDVLIIDIITVVIPVLFWNATTILFVHIIYAHYWVLSNMSRAIKDEMEGLEALKLDEIFNNLITSKRPASLSSVLGGNY